MASLTIFEGNAIKSGLYGLNFKKICFSRYVFGSGVHKTLYKTPNDPQFVKVGVVVVNHENQWEKNEKQ